MLEATRRRLIHRALPTLLVKAVLDTEAPVESERRRTESFRPESR